MTFTSRIVGTLAKLPPAGTTEVAVERDVAVKMPDGAVLLADHWYGAGEGPTPTVLLRSPYGRRQLGVIGRLFAERGYQAIIQSCRGSFGSGGQMDPFHYEQADGSATLEWVSSQPWFNDELVTFGPSYLGLTQWAVAEDAPDYLKAMSLNVTASRVREAVVYPGGSFALETGLTWLHQVGHQELTIGRVLQAQVRSAKAIRTASGTLPLNVSDAAAIQRAVPYYQDWLAHNEVGDLWWDNLNFGRRLAGVPPTSHVAGWYDIFLPEQVADYEALRDAGRQTRLTIGPWTHSSPKNLAAALRDSLEWYGQHVGPTPAAPSRAPVRVYVMGSGHWEEFAQWPPVAESQKWYLGRGGTLGTDVGVEGEPDRFRYDPADPTPSCGGPALNFRTAGPKDQGPRESRDDVLTYTSAVLRDDLTVIGPLSVTLHLRSSLEHTDFVVRLCDVSPKGKSTNLSDGIIRLVPGSVTSQADGTFTLAVSMWPTANTFRAGHRVRLQVSSGAHPLFARNPGSGEPLATATTLRPADQEVWHDAAHPSCIVLPVVRGR